MASTAAPKLDLMLLDTHSLMTLAIADISSYPDVGLINNAYIEITPPGWAKKSFPFNVGSVNIYRAFDLGMSCDGEDCSELPDGIYTIKYSVSPNNVYFIEREFLRVEQIKTKYRKAFLKIDQDQLLSCNKKNQLKEKLDSIDILIKGSIASSSICDNDTAYKLYMKADSMLDSILNDCSSPWGSTCGKCNS